MLDFVIFLWYVNSRRSVRRQTDARAGRKALVHQEAGIYPAISFIRRRTGLEKVLSIFIDESGDFGGYSKESPFYMVGMVFHDQSVDITEDIAILNRHIAEMGFPPHAFLFFLVLDRKYHLKSILLKLYFSSLYGN